MSPEELQRENQELHQILSIIAASYPSRYILGKTGDRVAAVIKRVVEGKPLFDE